MHFSLTKGTKFQMVEFEPLVLRKNILVVNPFLLYRYNISSLGKGVPLNFNNLELPLGRDAVCLDSLRFRRNS